MLDRHRQKKTLAPSLAVLDSQSVKAPHASDRGIDAHKKIVGRKRHVAVDSDGRLLLVNMTPANVADSTGAQMILDAMYRKWPSVKHFFADGAYERKSLMDKAAYLGFVNEFPNTLLYVMNHFYSYATLMGTEYQRKFFQYRIAQDIF